MSPKKKENGSATGTGTDSGKKKACRTIIGTEPRSRIDDICDQLKRPPNYLVIIGNLKK